MTTLQELGETWYEVRHGADPFGATMLGVEGFDDRVPDPSREAGATAAARLARVEEQARALDPAGLSAAEQVDREVLLSLSAGVRSDLEHGVWETTASADGYSNPQGAAFMAVPHAPLPDAAAVEGYLRRLAALGPFFDAVADRYRTAARDGRRSAAVGVGQALDQLAGHLARPPQADVWQPAGLPADVDADDVRARVAALSAGTVRPALERLGAVLHDELAPATRPDDRAGLCWVEGGEQAYAAALRRHTTTDLTPEQVHAVGLEVLDGLQEQWRELGGRVLGTRDAPGTLAALREDPALRFDSSAQVIEVVTRALERAEAARHDWFPPHEIADCVVEEIDPVEAENAALAHYRPPSADGSRPGAHCVLTAHPEQRFTYEYEALAFHESTPGHHLQIASAQRLVHLPRYRRSLDAEVCAYVEGWGLYSERLADEMGLYTSDLARLGMLSFDALRACRLVVDTGMHALGWSRQQAEELMAQHTATTPANVRNEVARYLAWPGQACAYMVGRREIVRLREDARRRLGPAFDVRGFHGAVLSEGAVPLDVLGTVVDRWVGASQGGHP